MKLSDQVCIRQQAKRLKELGIIQEAEWFWVYPVTPSVISSLHGIYHKSIASDILSDNEGDDFDHALAAAYSVAELGIMLPANSFSWFDGEFWNCGIDVDRPITHLKGLTEAAARAAELISRLETGSLTAEEANKRLKA